MKDPMTWLMIAVHTAIALLLAMFIFWLLLPVNMHYLGIPVGIIIWAAVLFKTPVFDWSFIIVEQNWVVLLNNTLVHDIIPTKADDRTGMYPLRSVREIGTGLRGKYPWERPFESVYMSTEILIGPGKDGTPYFCKTGNGVPVGIRWQTTLTPLRGYTVNLVRKSQQAAVEYFRSQFEETILEWVSSKDEADIRNSLDELRERFKKKYGGPSVIFPTEIDYGLFTGDPVIFEVKQSADFEKTSQAKATSAQIAAIVKELQAAAPHADPDIIMAVAASLTGNQIDGLLLIPGGVTGEAADRLLGRTNQKGKKGKP